MRRPQCATILGLLALATCTARSQGVYSVNAVGYINLTFQTGLNLLANQLDAAPDNTLDSLFGAGSGVLPGSAFSEWNPVTDQLLPWSSFNGASWSVNYTLGPNGIGGVLNSPGTAYSTIVGQVVNVNLNPNNTGPLYTFSPPMLGPGTYLLGLAAPINGATFSMIVGRAPNAGDSVETLDALTQVYSTTTFNGVTWDNGPPSLGIDQSAYFTLAAPEPSTLAMMGAGLVFLGARLRDRLGRPRFPE